MPFYTPLRYPGGKRRIAPLVARLIAQNRLADIDYAEAYAGGAAVALHLLFNEIAATVHINDLSRPVYAFWHTVLNHNADLCQRVRTVRLSMAEWKRQRAVYDARETADLADLGFAALFLNRTNRSGIINGGVIGGKQQTGEWGLDARFTKDELIARIRRVGRYKTRIALHQLDASVFIRTIVPTLSARSFTLYDPPYIENSEDLYLNTYDVDGHRALAQTITATDRPWIVTYDLAAVRENLYPGHRRMVYGLSYSAQDRYRAREVMFFSEQVALPDDWQPRKRLLLSPPEARHTVYGRMENVKQHPEIEEGPAALERFRRAVKTIISVPKPTAVQREKARPKKKKAASRKG